MLRVTCIILSLETISKILENYMLLHVPYRHSKTDGYSLLAEEVDLGNIEQN